MPELSLGNFLETASPTPGGKSLPLPDLQPGQVLKALVLARQADGQLLIRLLGRTLPVQSQAPLLPGQELEVVVRQTSPQLLLALLEPPEPPGGQAVEGQPAPAPALPGQAAPPHEAPGRLEAPMPELIRGRFLEQPGPGGRPLPAPDLQPGQVLKALVLESRPDGQALIRLLDRTILAQSQTPLAPGQSLEVVVRQTSPQLMLSLLEPPGPAPSGLGQALQDLSRGRARLLASLETLTKPLPEGPAPGPALGDLAARLQAVARQLLDPGRQIADAGLLPRQARLLGLDLEARLALLAQGQEISLPDSPRSLAPALLQHLAKALEERQDLDPGLAKAWREFGQAAQGLLEHCQDQSRLLGQLLPRQELLLMLPLTWTGGQAPAELLISLDDQGREGQGRRPRRLVFFLELSGLGPLAIEVNLLGQALQGRFLTQGPETADFLAQRLPALASRLGALGFEAALSAQARPPGQAAQEAPLARLIRQQGPHLSLRV